MKGTDSNKSESFRGLFCSYFNKRNLSCNKYICLVEANIKKYIRKLRSVIVNFNHKIRLDEFCCRINKYVDVINNSISDVKLRFIKKAEPKLVKFFTIAGKKSYSYFSKLELSVKKTVKYLQRNVDFYWNLFKEKGVKEVSKELSKRLVNCFRKNKNLISKIGYAALPITAIMILFGTVAYWNNADYGLVLAYDGQEIATISDERVIEEANQMVNQRLVYDSVSESDQSIEITPTYKLALVSSKKYATPSAVCDKIIQQSKGSIEEASGLYVNNELMAVVKDKDELQSVLNEVLNSATDREDAEVAFVEDVDKVNGLYCADSIVDRDILKDKLLNPIDDEVYYTVKDGDTPSEIAENFRMSLEELERINDNRLEELIYPDEQVKVQVAKKLLNVSVTYNEEYENSIPYDVEEEEDNSQYKGYSSTTQEGEEGTEKCLDKVTFVNGIEVSREAINREITKEAVNKKVTVGTKEKPVNNHTNSSYSGAVTTGSGALMWPVPYTRGISSPFGMRGGYMHSGIDISSGGIYGQAIVAADSGTVTSVQYLGYGYGYHVRIDHGNGVSTLYAHCSSINVTAGQTVSKGQAIAAVGSTGDSTGPHLHFEVIVGGSRVNPLSYV